MSGAMGQKGTGIYIPVRRKVYHHASFPRCSSYYNYQLMHPHTVAVVELEKVELRVSEADLTYTLCVNSSSATAVPLKIQITDSSDSALRDVGRIDYVLKIYYCHNNYCGSIKIAIILTDYRRLDLYKRIEPSSRKLCFNGSIMNDVIALEDEERFYLDLQVSSLNITSPDPSMSPEVVVGMKNRTTVIIIDDDGRFSQ